MAIEHLSADYTTGKQILVFPDHYVCLAHTFKHGDVAAVDVGGKKIIKAGTIYPANDATEIGIVFTDLDITYGDKNGALLVHGFVKTGKLPVIPSSTAKGALNMVKFFPLTAVATTLLGSPLAVAVGEAIDTEYELRVEVKGASFRAEASVLSNWTITGESVAKLKVEEIVIDESGRYATVLLKATAPTVAGSVTIVPKAVAMSTGDVPASALTVATVA